MNIGEPPLDEPDELEEVEKDCDPPYPEPPHYCEAPPAWMKEFHEIIAARRATCEHEWTGLALKPHGYDKDGNVVRVEYEMCGKCYLERRKDVPRCKCGRHECSAMFKCELCGLRCGGAVYVRVDDYTQVRCLTCNRVCEGL